MDSEVKTLILLNFCDGMYGGIESFLLNAFYCLDREKYDVTFLTCGRSTYGMFRNDITVRSGHIEEIPILPATYNEKVRLYIELKKYFKKKRPDIVHVNSGTLSIQILAAKAAKSAGVGRVILHSHNFLPNQTGIKEGIKTIFKNILVKYGDSYLACSEGAALWMFPRKMVERGSVIIIPNGVDTKKFLYNNEKRKIFREEFNLHDELLVGNIGRFQSQKNHKFMIKIMEQIVQKNQTVKMLLAGEGPLKEDIRKLVNEKKLDKNVLFLGERKDMDSFLAAIDVFILPSLYEGLPIASVEAQASGVKTILANTITKEANVSGSAIYLPVIGDNVSKLWADEIYKQEVKQDRLAENKKVYDAGFDVYSCYKKMIEIYGEEPVHVNNK